MVVLAVAAEQQPEEVAVEQQPEEVAVAAAIAVFLRFDHPLRRVA